MVDFGLMIFRHRAWYGWARCGRVWLGKAGWGLAWWGPVRRGVLRQGEDFQLEIRAAARLGLVR